MQPPADTITDVWFHSALALSAIVEKLGLSDVIFDAENYWEWAIGTLDDVQLDVTRTHRRGPASVDTRIFRIDNQPFSTELRTELVDRLLSFVSGSVSWGRWVYLQGDDFDLQEVGRAAGGE